MATSVRWTFNALLALAFACSTLAAGEPAIFAPVNPVTPTNPVIPPVLEEVPYEFGITDGLYATVTGMQAFKPPKIKNERKFKLSINGFKKDIEVRALLQDSPAPLVVIFLGLASKSKDPVSRLWQAQLEEAGCHVLVFDSIFRASFNKRSRHGVCGNPRAEAYVAATVIESFMKMPDLEGRVTKIGLLGASYGGMLALNYAVLAKEGKVKPVPDRVLVFSPPACMRTSVEKIDRFYDDDLPRFGFLDLFKMKGAEPVPSYKPIPFSQAMMRAGIGYVFYEDLEEAIDISKDIYKFELPKGKTRRFQRFIEEVTFPYWKQQGTVQTIDEFWMYGDLTDLMKASPEYAHVVLTNDDPLNEQGNIDFIQREFPKSRVTILPHGGHLGFLGCSWAKDRVIRMFREPAALPPPPHPPTEAPVKAPTP